MHHPIGCEWFGAGGDKMIVAPKGVETKTEKCPSSQEPGSVGRERGRDEDRARRPCQAGDGFNGDSASHGLSVHFLHLHLPTADY